MNIFEINKDYNLIEEYKNNFGYVFYNCDKQKILGHHNFYNFYYIASVMKPIILLIYCEKFKKNIKEEDLKKILISSNNFIYLNYARHIEKEDEDIFFKKYYGNSNPFSINIADTKLLKDVDLIKSYRDFLKLTEQEKKEFLKIELDRFFLNKIPDKFLDNIDSDFFFMYYFKKNINFYHFRYGVINNLEKYPKCSPYFMLKLYNDLLHNNKFDKYGANFKKYMKNIGTSTITFLKGGVKGGNYPEVEKKKIDFYHKTGNHTFFRNEVLYFNFEGSNYILSYMSQPNLHHKYGIQTLKNAKIMMTIIHSYLIKKIKIEENLDSYVILKYFSSTALYISNKFLFKGNLLYLEPNSNNKIKLNDLIIDLFNNKIRLEHDNKIKYVDNLNVITEDLVEIKTLTKSQNYDTHRLKGELNIFVKDNRINIFLKIPLIDYVLGVLYHESLGYWIEEKNKNYIEAFSIVVKNYLINRILKDIIVLNNAMFQIYRYYDNKNIRNIVKKNINKYLFNDSLVLTFYSSSCGGATKSYDNIKGVKDVIDDKSKTFNCDISPYNLWDKTIDTNLLNIDGIIKNINTIENNYLVDTVIIETSNKKNVILTHHEFKNLVGWRNLKSQNYKLELLNKNTLKINGRGLGHHLGFCVWGAKHLSNNDWNYQRILKHYFNNCEISNLKL